MTVALVEFVLNVIRYGSGVVGGLSFRQAYNRKSVASRHLLPCSLAGMYCLRDKSPGQLGEYWC